MTAWLDRIAADLLHLEQDLRTTLRTVSRGGRPPPRARWDRLEISTAEARTLLRGAMPAPIAATRLREPHARLVAALSVLQGHLLTLNDPWVRNRPGAALAAACSVMDELRRWIGIVRWTSAAQQAGVRWPVPQAITAIMQPQTGQAREHLPNAAAGQLHHPAAAIRQVHQLRTEQLALELELPASADVVELRQLRLKLTHPQEARHGTTAA